MYEYREDPDLKDVLLPDKAIDDKNFEERFKEIVENHSMDLSYGKMKSGELNVVIAPPRFFPSLSWFAWMCQFDMWVPVLSCAQEPSWMNINLGKKNKKHIGLDRFPLKKNAGFIDSWSYDEKFLSYRSDIGQNPSLYSWMRTELRRFREKMNHFYHCKEAEEILKIQLNLSIKNYEMSLAEDMEDEFGQTVKISPVISSLLVDSTNRVGTGIVDSVSEWPQFVWDNKIELSEEIRKLHKDIDLSSFRNMPSSPIMLRTRDELHDSILNPVYLFMKTMNKKLKINIYLDLASVGDNGSAMYFKDYSGSQQCEVMNHPVLNFNGRSILAEIAQFGLRGLRKRFKESILNTELDIGYYAR